MWGNIRGGRPSTCPASEGMQIWRLENRRQCGRITSVTERAIRQVPLMLSAREEEEEEGDLVDGARKKVLVIICGTMGSPSLAEFRDLQVTQKFADLKSAIQEKVPQPVGAAWKFVLPDMMIPDFSHLETTLGELFGLPEFVQASLRSKAHRLLEGLWLKFDQEDWMKAFRLIDQNGDGAISRKEWYVHQEDTDLYDVIKNGQTDNLMLEEWQRACDIIFAER